MANLREQVDMAEPTVQCGCTRRMNLDAGARVKVTVPQAVNTGCAVDDCSLIADPRSTVVRLCKTHLTKVLIQLAPAMLAKFYPSRWVELERRHMEEFGNAAELPEWIEADRRIAAEQDRLLDRRWERKNPIVYLITCNGRVKIGTTVRLDQRMKGLTLPPDAEVALTLVGSYDLEGKLKERFSDERLGRTEWFTLSPRIEAFIASEKRKQAAA